MDMTTQYLGLELEHPLVASASPLSQSLDGIRRLVDGGVSAVVLYSLFEEQLQHEAATFAAVAEAGAESFAEAISYLPALPDAGAGARTYLSLLERAAAAVDVPVLGSLNGVTPGGWVRHARSMQDAGASAIELNVYWVPGDLAASGREVEERQLEVLRAVKQAVTVPVAVKLSPYFSSLGEMARRLDEAGADGLVLCNRFVQPDIDPDTLSVVSRIALSSPVEARLPLTWIALLHGRLGASLAASTGVEAPADVVRFVLAGADVVMTTSALLRHGPAHAAALRDGLEAWLRGRGFTSLAAARGLMIVARELDGAGYARAGYVGVLGAANRAYGPADGP
jgi:dihydroorotate dehydrogenase (fumarate)